ncbi:hypothetical protein [Agromyces sp. Root81]|uniref:hypothetical protein n=1 Tax=Agromyces sp. Root81 TaxID=1736601 RepID=UPI000A6C6060|nr:hypothetical protein [Agromyces sp. Root81]
MKVGFPVGLMFAVLLTLGSFALVAIRAFGSRGDGWADILEFLPFLAAGIGFGLALNFAYAKFARMRLHRLAKDHPDAVLFTAEMTPALMQFLRSEANRRENPASVGRLPHFYTAVASVDGLSFWRGSAPYPVKFWQIDWGSIRDLRPELVQLQFKTAHAIHFETGESPGALQIVPFADGMFTVSWGQNRVSELVETLKRLRTPAR